MAEEVVIRTKERKYRGHNVEELKKLDAREFAKYLPSRSRRTVLRNFDVVEKFTRACEEKISRNKRIKTHLRDMIIMPRMVGMRMAIYNGKAFQEVEITADMIGHRLGEFSQTRARVTHSSAGLGATKGSRAKKK